MLARNAGGDQSENGEPHVVDASRLSQLEPVAETATPPAGKPRNPSSKTKGNEPAGGAARDLLATETMSYVVLARKWRPMRFEDLVGQDHVAKTLENAIKTDRVAHAFLFTGVRGVGKTTSARILAKALNCMGADGARGDADRGPTAQPCLSCPACTEIALGTDVDVREIDGASYNGVDEVRKLQEQLPYRPSRDRYKIYIVDEVHMLSQSAWNAFLKTLEEPPPHVKFIFATTEVHKVPVTILSRVQRFDFKLIATQEIAARLKYVLSNEKITADDSSVQILAREAAGSMRDAMSLLDQVIAWGGDQLSGQDVARVLGVASRQVLHDIAAALVAGDASKCLSVVSDLTGQGFDMVHVARDLLALLRDLVVAKVCTTPKDLLDLSDEEAADVLTLAAKTDADDLLRLHQGFSTSFDDVARSGQPRAALEMLLVRLSRRPPLLPVDDLITRLSDLERRLSGAGRSAAPVRGGGQPPQAGERARPRARESRPDPTPRAERSEDPPRQPPPASQSPAATPPTPRPAAGRAGAGSFAAAAAPEERRPSAEAREEAAPRQASASSKRGDPVEPADVEPKSANASLTVWVQVLDDLAARHPEIAAVLQHAALLGLSDAGLMLGYEPGNVFARQANDKDTREALAEALSRTLGKSVPIHIEEDSKRAQGSDTVYAQHERERQEAVRRALQAARKHPAVVSALEVLGARIKDLKLASS